MELDINDIVMRYQQEVATLTHRAIMAEAETAALRIKLKNAEESMVK